MPDNVREGGAQTGTAVTALTYDLADHLTGIDAPGGSADDAAFTLDALGRFATRTINGTTDTYRYVGTSETVSRITTGGTDTDSVVSPAGDRLGVKVGATLNWFVPDLHGDIAGSLSADESSVVNAIRYDAYGQTIATGTAGGTRVGDTAWAYQGRLDISPQGLGTPLYDMSARFYDPGIGAFTQLDSVMGGAQDPRSMNRFLYAEANPATLIDPTGHGVDCQIGQSCGVSERKADQQRQREYERRRNDLTRRSSFERAHHRTTTYHKTRRDQQTDERESNRISATGRIPTNQSTGCTAARLNCTISDFQQMSFPKRSEWISDFQESYDPGGWINAIRGVVDAGLAAGIDETTWFGTVDARILSNIQTGYIGATTSRGQSTVSGVGEWTEAWKAVLLGKSSEDVINTKIADAEAASIAQGRREATAMGRAPTLGEATALLGSDGFRVAQRNRGMVRDAAKFHCGFLCAAAEHFTGQNPATSISDHVASERNYAVAFVGAFGAFTQNRLPHSAGFPGGLFDFLYPS